MEVDASMDAELDGALIPDARANDVEIILVDEIEINEGRSEPIP